MLPGRRPLCVHGSHAAVSRNFVERPLFAAAGHVPDDFFERRQAEQRLGDAVFLEGAQAECLQCVPPDFVGRSFGQHHVADRSVEEQHLVQADAAA